MHNAKTNTGFTIYELLITSIILIFVLSGIIAVYGMSETVWAEGRAQIALQQDAAVAMEKMTRGVDGKNGIREAQSVVSPLVGATATQITLQYLDGISRTFYFSAGADEDSSTALDNQIRYIDELDTDTAIIDKNIRVLTFRQASLDFVEIVLGLQDTVRDRTVNIDLATQVKLRN